MSATLTIPAKQSPFPYAAAGIAAYTGKANINIDDSASAINLEIDGSSINEEETIVRILAKGLGINLGHSEDSEKAILISAIVPWLINSYYYFRLQDSFP
jgi:glutamyl-tRNA synthetase